MKKMLIVLILAVAAAAVFFLYQLFRQPDVTMAEAGEKLAQQYNGTVIKSTEENGQFVYMIQVAEGEYKVAVDSETGELSGMTRTNQEAAPSKEPKQGSENTTRQLTPEEAGQIALKQVPGVIDEVELGDEEEAGSYIVDIDAENGEEATVQVNAVSGDVISISWDD
ncbi:PepSY domain-containing protein [Domibacillus sp. A3M-37]|uniref:PepSY domain-containing protein n=1 Tax=Domibacillus TaxID=1433999 RepID=UPI00069819A7|nr:MULTISPECIES: PepSY domain-containing protein [Domibacillus]MCP3761772.1 PepSY domain-containing protein [Domibacillus sp. A3M-37]